MCRVEKLTVTRCIIRTRNENNFGVKATEGLQLGFERRATSSNQHDAILGLDAFDQLRKFLLQALGVRLRKGQGESKQ